MKKTTIITLAALLLAIITLGSCDGMSTRGYLGTMAGAEIGGTLGEAFGWMSTSRHGGPGKALMGRVIGSVAGAVIGHSIATSGEHETLRDNDRTNGYDSYSGTYNRMTTDYQTSGGYDVSTTSTPYMRREGTQLSICNLTFEDEDGDARFGRGETINIMYEVTNNSGTPAQVQLVVDDPSHPNNFAFSPMTTATIQPHQTIRYKAKAFCQSRPKSRTADIIAYANSTTHGNVSLTLRIRIEK